MKKYLPILAALGCAALLLLFSTPVSSSSQKSGDGKKLIKKIAQPDDPIEISKLKVKGQPRNFDGEFDADEEWVKGLSVDVKNVSSREIIYFQVELDFPVDDTGARFFVVYLEYGQQPTGGGDPGIKPLRPGEVVTLSVRDGIADALKRKLRERGSGKALGMNRATLYASQVWFDVNTAWAMGTILTRDPVDKSKWNPADSSGFKPIGAGGT